MFLLTQLRFSLSTCIAGRSACAGWTTLESRFSTLSSQGAETPGISEKQLFIKNRKRIFQPAEIRQFSTSEIFHQNKSYYEVLEVPSQATGREIRNAYLKLSKVHHPDRNVDNQESATKFQAISEAYETLSNPDLRSKYDTGVLGHSSSVADREKSSHRFENEAFYGSRSKRGGDSTPKGLDDWVSHQRNRSFRKSQLNKQGINCGQKMQVGLHAERLRSQEITSKLGKLILYPVFFISFIMYLMGKL